MKASLHPASERTFQHTDIGLPCGQRCATATGKRNEAPAKRQQAVSTEKYSVTKTADALEHPSVTGHLHPVDNLYADRAGTDAPVPDGSRVLAAHTTFTGEGRRVAFAGLLGMMLLSPLSHDETCWCRFMVYSLGQG